MARKKNTIPVQPEAPQEEQGNLLQEDTNQEAANDPQAPEADLQDESVTQPENATQEADQSSETTEQEADTEDAYEEPAPVDYSLHKLTISNPTKSTRGLMLKKGVMLLQPGEIKVVPDDIVDEIRALFKSRAIQAIVDAGMLRISGLKDEELVEQPTPLPPASLTDSVQVGDTGLTVGANATRQYDPDSKSKLKNAGVMNIG